jgi:hypothetical protein
VVAGTSSVFCGYLTVKLRARTEAPALGAEGAQSLSARGAKPQTHHSPLQRLLDDATDGLILDLPRHLGLDS